MAQDEPAPQLTSRAKDESAPGVARISVVQRDVSTMRSDSKDWVAATANAPVVHGDTIATGSGSRTELQLDYANVLRLDQGAESKVAELDPHAHSDPDSFGVGGPCGFQRHRGGR